VTTDLLSRARAGDSDAFGRLTDPYRRELQVHCYRILGSLHDAEDVVQDTLLAAWRGPASFEERSTLRAWLYRIATNRCLNALRSARRRPPTEWSVPDLELPPPSRLDDAVWLQPFPDALLQGLVEPSPGPEACYEMTEAISLAFVRALQLLPARQRAVLILRDVLGYRALEVADVLDTTAESVNSALKRARNTLRSHHSTDQQPAPASGFPAEQELVSRLVRAYRTGDMEALATMLTEDVVIAMPPLPLEYHGRELAARFDAAVTFRDGRTYDLIPTRANGQLAFASYLRDPSGGTCHAKGLLVFTLAGNQIRRLTGFSTGVLPYFGFPLSLPGTVES
jgi:RNA polymerase sigma-70 factor (ECF subfamily)